MEEVIIRRAEYDEYDDVMDMVFKVFLKFEAEEYGEQGTQSFANFITSPDVKKLFLTDHYLMYVAVAGDKIVGMISLRSGNHISLLFVVPEYHNRGIGKRLVLRGAQYLINYTDFNSMTVHSSPYAIGFYHNLGFEDTGEQDITDGVIFTPMELFLNL